MTATQPDYDKLQAIAETAEREAPLSMERWEELFAEAEEASAGFPVTEFMFAFAPEAGFPTAELVDETEKVEKRISGNSDIALNAEGARQAEELGERLAQKGGLDVLYSSPLKRAVQTADAITKAVDGKLSVKRFDALCPWHLGEFEGKQPSDVREEIDSYIEHPDRTPPGKGADGAEGESFNAAKTRQLDFLASAYSEWAKGAADTKLGIVMHSRGLELLQSWLEAGCPADYELDQKDLLRPDDPDHATVLYWRGNKTKEVDLESDKPLKPGVYLILHSLTDDDTDEGNQDLKDDRGAKDTEKRGGEEGARVRSGSQAQKKDVYLPPVEVVRAAKRAWDVGTSVIGVTEPLSEGRGLELAEVRMIAEHFADVGKTGCPESSVSADAWGGSFAVRWAERVFKRVAQQWPLWIGVDLDGTLAKPLETYSGTEIGQPIAAMVERVKGWLAEGKTVKVFTARVANDPGDKCRHAIEVWTEKYVGRKLEVTNEKDPGMVELWDDRSHNPVEKAGSGVMLAFWPDEATRKKLAVPEGESADDLHITLAYFGKLDELAPGCLEALDTWLKAFTQSHGPVSGTITGIGIFPATPQSDGKDVAYRAFYSDGIQEFRQELVEAAEAAGCVPRKNHGYNPHMTLRYLVPGQPHGLGQPENVDITFDKIVLSVAGEKTEYPLAGESSVGKLADFVFEGDFTKLDDERRLVFGWFSVTEIEGETVTDVQGDRIAEATLEAAAYDYVLYARVGGRLHSRTANDEVVEIGRLVESVVFTKEKQAAMVKSLREQDIPAVLDLHAIAWWGGFKIDDADVWEGIKSGRFKAFSVGGKGKRQKVG